MTTPTGARLARAGDEAAGGQRGGLGHLGGQGLGGDVAEVPGVAVEAVGRHRDLHPRSHGGGGPRLGDDQREELGGLGPDGRRPPWP